MRVDLKKNNKIKNTKKRERPSINYFLHPSLRVSQRSFQHSHSTKYSDFFSFSFSDRRLFAICIPMIKKKKKKGKKKQPRYINDGCNCGSRASIRLHPERHTSHFPFLCVFCQCVQNVSAFQQLPSRKQWLRAEIFAPCQVPQFIRNSANPNARQPVPGGGTERIRSTV